MHNSRLPLNRIFAVCDPVTWPHINRLAIGDFGDFSFSRFGFIVRTDRQTDTQTESQTLLNALLPRLSSAWVINKYRAILNFVVSFAWENCLSMSWNYAWFPRHSENQFRRLFKGLSRTAFMIFEDQHQRSNTKLHSCTVISMSAQVWSMLVWQFYQ